MNFSIIPKSQLEGSLRIDPDYYQQEYLSAVERIRKTKHERLGDIISLLSDYHANGSYQTLSKNVSLSADPDYALMVRAIDLEKNDYESDVRYVSRHAYDFLKKTKMYGQEIIIDKIGNAGEVFLTPNLGRPVTLGMNLFMLRLKEGYEPAYVYSFLISKYGRALIYQRITGTAPPSIDKESVRGILIPLPSKQTNQVAKSIIEDYFKILEESKKLYSQAEDLLLDELGLKNTVFEDELSYIVNFSDVQDVNRVDPEYFQPKYQEILKRIEKFKTTTLADRDFEIITGAYSKNYSLQGTNYIRSVNIQGDISIDKNDMYKTGESLGEKFKVRAGDIITSRVGSIGTLGIIPEDLGKSFISDNILRIRNSHKELNDFFLAIYLKEIGSILMNRLSRGSVQQRLNQETLREIVVPILSQKDQLIIAGLVRKSHEARRKSKELLEEAKKTVEEMIERGGDQHESRSIS